MNNQTLACLGSQIFNVGKKGGKKMFPANARPYNMSLPSLFESVKCCFDE